ncbi:MAG: Ig-like domain-containing protein, partial [candidate division KSB1 bacterium]
MRRSAINTLARLSVAALCLRTLSLFALVLLAASCSKKTLPNSPDPFPDLHVVSVSPSDNATGVAAATNPTITFSAEVPVSTLGMVLAPAPQNFYSSLQAGSDPKQIISRAALSANTNYSVVIFSASDKFSDRLRTPFVSHFSTGSANAAGTVSGVSVAPFNEPTRGFVGLLRKQPLAVFEASAPDQDFLNNLVSVTTIKDSTGAYTLTNVPPGTYWPFSALDVDRNGRFSLEQGSDRMQGYDANTDFIADSIVVA